MNNESRTENEGYGKGRKAIGLVFLMLASLIVSAVPNVSASHTTQYGVQRDPVYISIGDLDCDGDNDIASGSGFGHFLSFLYNDGSGGFGDRQDVQISNNDSFRAGFRDVADGNRVEIADVDGDDANDIIYYQQNVRFVGESFVRPANLTVLKGDCDLRVNEWEEMFETITVINPYLAGFDVGDINDDGYVDVAFSSTDATFANQFVQIYKGPDYSLPANQHAPISVPLTSGFYQYLKLGNWGEDLQTITDPLGNEITAPGECEDLDIWLLRTPPYNAGVGYSAGSFDNMSVLEYDCVTGQFPNPMDPTGTGTIHEFTLDAEHDFELFGLDIADTTPNDDVDRIDLIAAVDGITGNVSYATRTGNSNSWNTQNYVDFGDYLGASVTIADVNQDGELDFFVPTEVTLLDTQESTVQNQTYLLRPNLRAINTVQILLADPNSNGYLDPLSFDVGRRPTMAMPGQLQGGNGSALEVVIGQEDYTYRFSNNAMWLDTQGYAGQGDYLSVLVLDNYDLGITNVDIAPSVTDPATFQSIVGEGNRWVNVTVKNTGLMPISGGSLEVDLQVREVLGGTDTIVYSNDFESASADVNTGGAQFNKYSYTGEYDSGDSSWHIDEDRYWVNGTTYQEDDVVHYNNSDYMCGNNNTTSCNSNPEEDNSSWEEVVYLPWEAKANPTNFMWSGVTHTYDVDNDTVDATGYYNHMDEALILEGIDLSGADAAFLDMDALCSAGFFTLFLNEPYDVVERWLYEDSCSIEVWSDGAGWETVWRYGGWDNERKYRIEDRTSSAPDPEYNDYNGDFFGEHHSTLWNNYTENGGIKESCYMPYLIFGFPFAECYEDGGLDQTANTIDLTPYAGQEIDIRFRFRSGLEGSVGPDGSADDSGLDGFAIDNITIRKRDVAFGESSIESQQLSNLNLVAGESIQVQLNADFVDNTTYYISTELSNADLGAGQPDQDSTNDLTKFQLTVRNLYDPGLFEEPWLDLLNGERYASGDMPITVGVQNWGNTFVDFDVEAKVRNALPDLIAVEDFASASGQGLSIWYDDGNNNSSRLDDTTGGNDMLPQNEGVFKNHAYWLGDPTTGYGDDWNETLTLDPIQLTDGDADFTFLTFDYFAEGDHISDRDGNALQARDFTRLEVTWVKDGEVFDGIVYGSWTDLNENGLRYAYNPVTDSVYNYCEDFDQNGLYEEVQYAGDHSGDVGEDGFVTWFDSDNLVNTVRIDLSHIHLFNQTSEDSFGWTDECTSLSGSEVTFTWRFFSNDDGVNGNAGYAGFGIDNIRVDDYTFIDDGEYTQSVTGIDAAQKRVIEMGVHDFQSGLYRIDLMTLYNNTDNTSNWFDKPEISQANNVSTILFEIANADITLLQADVMDCVSDSVYTCAYSTNWLNESGVRTPGLDSHDFSIPMLNGVIEGIYEVSMKIVDETTGQIVFESTSDNGPFILDPHQRHQANWSSPYDQWFDGHTYNISFQATLLETNELSGNERYFSIDFLDQIDVAILSNPTDQNRLQRVKQELKSINKSYTQIEVEDWFVYGTHDWLVKHYNKVLLPWQTDYNVEYGQYYELLGTPNEQNADFTLTETLIDYMEEGGTLQVHLGPYRSDYDKTDQSEPDKLPYGMDIVMRNFWNSTVDNRIHSENTSILDPFHPIFDGVSASSFDGINGGQHVALSGLDTSQVNPYNIPQVCGDAPIGSTEGGWVKDGGTFNVLIRDRENTNQALLSTCNIEKGGMIVTTIDVENPSVSPFGDETFPLLSNLIEFHLSPYPDGFEIAGQGFELTIDGSVQSMDVLTGAYARKAIKSNATLDLSFITDVPGIHADWLIESADNGSVTGWDGNSLNTTNSRIHQPDPSSPITATFCVEDQNEALGCKIDAEWKIWLFLHDSFGNTRITNISLYTNDVNADSTPPIAQIDIIQDQSFLDFVEFVGYEQTPTGKQDENDNWIMIESPKYRVRISDTGDTSVKFSSANSSDVGTGIKSFTWLVNGDGGEHEYELPGSQTEWTYTFRNLTPGQNLIMVQLSVYDQRDQDNEDPTRIFFEVVGELFGDEAPEVDFDSISTADGDTFTALESDIVNLTGTVVDNDDSAECDVRVEVSLDDTEIFDKGEGVKTAQKALGRFDWQEGLCDGDQYFLSLNISHKYLENPGEGNAGIIYIRVTEGSYVVEENIQLYTRPKVEETGNEGASEGGASLTTVMVAGIGAVLLLAILGATMMFMRRGGSSDQQEDSVESFGGVEQMDPVEAYVQQLVAQGYDEQMARQYATQYYAQYYAKQKGGQG